MQIPLYRKIEKQFFWTTPRFEWSKTLIVNTQLYLFNGQLGFFFKTYQIIPNLKAVKVILRKRFHRVFY